MMWIEAVRMRTRGMRWRDEEFIVFTAVCCGEKGKKGKYGDGVGDGFAEMMGNVVVELTTRDELGDQIDGLRHAGHDRRIESKIIIVVLGSAVLGGSSYNAHVALNHVHATHARETTIEPS